MLQPYSGSAKPQFTGGYHKETSRHRYSFHRDDQLGKQMKSRNGSILDKEALEAAEAAQNEWFKSVSNPNR